MVSTPFRDFCSFRPAGAAHALSAIVLALKSAGKSTVTHIFRWITASSMPANFSNKHRPVATSTTWSFGRATNFRRVNMEQSARYGLLAARILVAVVFLLNAFGIIDQSIPARELAERGAP